MTANKRRAVRSEPLSAPVTNLSATMREQTDVRSEKVTFLC